MWRRFIVVLTLASAVLLSLPPLATNAQQCVPPPAGSSREAYLLYADCLEKAKGDRAQPGQVVCPLVVNVGSAWLNKRPITVTNVGNGVAMGVTLYWSGVTTSVGGGSAAVQTPLFNWGAIGPGQAVTMEDYAHVVGGGYSAAAQACVGR